MAGNKVDIAFDGGSENIHLDKPLTISFRSEDFADFITKLLGQPQSINRHFYGVFELDHEWFCNLHALIVQRIHRQNEYKMLQFSAEIYFEDGVVRKLEGFDTFRTFTEVNPYISFGVTLHWSFLIIFKNKNIPEKQDIIITFLAKMPTSIDPYEEALRPMWAIGQGGFIALEINHTERTWGDDILGLLQGHIDTHIKQISSFRSWLSKNSQLFSITIVVSIIVLMLLSLYIIAYKSNAHIMTEFYEIDKLLVPESERVLRKLYLYTLNRMETLRTPIWIFAVAVVTTFSVIFIVPRFALQIPKSFVIFTKRTREKMEKSRKKYKIGRKLLFAFSIGIFSSLIATVIYAAFFV